MLLIDGVRYHLWTPEKEQELEAIVKEHFQEIFGQDAVLFEKSKLQTHFKEDTIPDGYIIHLGREPGWSILEVELSKHPLHDHITSQLNKFIDAIEIPQNQQKLVRELNDTIKSNATLKEDFKAKLGDREIFEFLTQVISQKPTLIVVIEERTPELESAVKRLGLSTKIVELKTYAREGVGLAVHAHLFEPLVKEERIAPHPTPQPPALAATPQPVASVPTPQSVARMPQLPRTRTVNPVKIQHLLNVGLVREGQKIFRDYKGKRFEAEILSSGRIKLLSDNSQHNSLSAASDHLTQASTDGWVWWKTLDNDGREILIHELRERYVAKS